SLGFVHISEASTEIINGVAHFEISEALSDHFLPVRETIFENYLDNSCMPCLLQADLSKDDFVSTGSGYGIGVGTGTGTGIGIGSNGGISGGVSIDIEPKSLPRRTGSVDSVKEAGLNTDRDKENDLAVIVERLDDGYLSPSSAEIMGLDLERKKEIPRENIAGTNRVH
ncbi:MAG: hypothetical protein ACPH15_05250, partial [Pseudomonadales bacterium]